jgi:DNA-binding response OmpR family regulator
MMILIVDDDEAMAETCSMFLESQGFEVNIATSGAQALGIVRDESPELMISDCVMPGMSGLELSRELKADPVTAHMPILLMSGSMRGDVARNGTFDAFLRKPFLAENLLLEVRNLLIRSSAAPINEIKA